MYSESESEVGFLDHTPDLDDEKCGPKSTMTASLFHGQDGDIILRTSDSVDFRVFKVILSLASPVFRTMFDLPQPTGADDNGSPPSIPISESSVTLDLLLRFCYPVDAPRLIDQDVSVIGDILGAALKYEIEAIIRAAQRALRKCARLNSKNAHAAYAIACHLHLEAEARAAAFICLKWPFPGPVVPQLALMSGMDHYNLLDYHRRAADSIVSMYNSYEFIVETCAAIMPTTHLCPGSVNLQFFTIDQTLTVTQYSWLSSSKAAWTDTFRYAPLDVEKLSLSSFAHVLATNNCHVCKNRLFQGWEQTRPAIIALMMNKLEQISLDLSWK